MLTIQARKYVNGKALEIHQFPLPQLNEKGFYRCGVSYNAYRTFESTRLYNANLKGRSLPFTFILKPVCEWEEGERQLKHTLALLGKSYTPRPMTVFTHESLWDFYNAVGFDRKKKQYSDASPEHSPV